MTDDEVAEVRKKHQLSIDGADCPKPITQFNQVRKTALAHHSDLLRTRADLSHSSLPTHILLI